MSAYDELAAAVAAHGPFPMPTGDTGRRVRRFTPLEEAVRNIETAIAPLKGDERAGADMVLAYLRTLTTPDTTVPRDLRPGADAARRMIRDRQTEIHTHTWVTALDGNDQPALDGAGRTWEHCGICGKRKTPEDPRDSPLHRTYETSHDLPAFPGACEACGDTDAQWCPDCAACRKGCHGGHENNDCTHPNAPWQVAQ